GSFPLGEKETWNVSSNATIRAMIQWHFEGPSASFGFWHTFNATVPIRMRLHSGMLEDVTTPAGTFSSIPVRVAVPTMDRLATADREDPSWASEAMSAAVLGWRPKRGSAVTPEPSVSRRPSA